MSGEDSFLYRSFQRALLFNIPAGVRMISFARTNVSRIDVQVVSGVDLDPEARDFIFSAAGEVEGDFVDAITCKVARKGSGSLL